MSYNIENPENPSPEGLKNPNYRVGLDFIKWGFWLFIFGIAIGFGVLAHYLMGSKYRTGDEFINNVSLWWGSPLMFASGFIQIGGLGMSILGFIYIKTARLFPNFRVLDKDKIALALTIVGLLGLFLTGYVGYFIVDSMYPGFYYIPIHEGKNMWLILQGFCCLLYMVGVIVGFSNIHNTMCDYYKRNKGETRENYRR